MVPSVLSINIGKHKIFHRHDEAMLFVMLKACLRWKNILLFRSLKELYICIYIDTFSPFTNGQGSFSNSKD